MSAAIVVGAGVNGLVAAFYLARAGWRVQVLERRPHVGGCLVSEPLDAASARASGTEPARLPLLSHVAGPLLPAILEDTGLGASLVPLGPVAQLSVFDEQGGVTVLDDRRPPRGVNTTVPAADGTTFAEFVATSERLAAVVRTLVTAPPPTVDHPTLRELMQLLSTGRRVRGLGRREAFRLFQWAPMPIADLVEEWFEGEACRAAFAARSIFGRAAGPKSAWTTFELLLQTALSGHVVTDSTWVKGGPGAVTAALAAAAEKRGVTIRTDAQVQRIDVANGAATGVTLVTGERLAATAVVSSADPKSTCLGWVDAGWLGPEYVANLRAFRARGVVAKVNFVLAGLPRFEALAALSDADAREVLAGRLQFCATLGDLERAFDASKYGEYSEAPYLDVRIPSVVDDSLSPGGQHVMSVVVQFAPRDLRASTWNAERERLGDIVVRILSRHATNLPSLVVSRQVLTPEDLEADWALGGGHIHHGEHAIEQLLLMRPVYGWANYATPVEGLYLCGAGTHPSGGSTGVNGYLAARTILSR